MNISKTKSEIQKIAKKKYGLETFASGVAAPGVIKNFIIELETKKYYSEEEARKLIVDLTEDYILLINASPEVKKHFEFLPITEMHAYFLINFINEKNEDRSTLAGISLGLGNIRFLTLDKFGYFEAFQVETYSEAYFKIYGTKPPE